MLNIIYGTDSSDREEYADLKMGESAKNGKNVWILVPEQFSLFTERAVIKKFGIKAQTRMKVITFSRLCNLVLAKLGPLRMQYIDGAGRQIIAARTIRELKNKLGVLGTSSGRRGFASTIVDLVSEFKRYGVSPEMLHIAADNCEREDFALKLRDISKIYETYDEFLERHAADAEDNLAIIIPQLKKCGFLNGELYITHFRSFTPVEYEAIGEMMKLMDVYAVMCCDSIDKPSSLFAPVAASCRSLIERAKDCGAEYGGQIMRENSSPESEGAYLRRAYFDMCARPRTETPEYAEIYETANNYGEVEAAADLIVRLCREEGRKFSDFLILARDTECYNRVMPAVFASRGIDVFLDTGRSILTKPPAVLISSAIEILAYGYSYERVMSMARTGLCAASDEQIDLFENYLLAVNPSHKMWGEKEWSYCPKDYDIKVINSTKNAVLSFVEEIDGQLSGRKTAGQICNAILNVLRTGRLAERIEKICDSFTKEGMPYLADEYRQVWNSLVSILSQIAALMDEENITWKDFGELFKSACGGISVGVTPQMQGSVVFSNIDRFRSSGTPVVIVLGMTEGVFPASHSAEGIISDAEREELAKGGISLAPGADTRRREEQLLIYSVLSAAKERLYLFSPVYNDKGVTCEPSPIIKRIRSKLFPNIKVTCPDKSGDILKGAEGKNAAFDVLCSLLARCGGNSDRLSKAERELYGFFRESEDYGERLEEIVRIMNTKPPERISKAAVEAIYGKKIMLSASRLEKYNACAFAYFMSYGLFLSEREKAGIEPRSMGSIQHAALYRYFSELKGKNASFDDITKEKCFADIAALVRKEAIDSSELLYESSAYYKYVVTRMQGIAGRTAWEAVKFFKSSVFRPIGFEIKIGTEGELPVLNIKDENGSVFAGVRGMIDRVDFAVIDGKNYISVIDYKSSSKNLDARLAEAGVNIQPLLYADIVCRRMNASPAAMLYMQMTDPIIEYKKLKSGTESEIERSINGSINFGGWLNDNADVVSGYSSGGENGEVFISHKRSALISEGEMKRRISLANKRIKESAMEIYSGNVKAEPYIDKNYNACQYCIFGQLCDFG